MNRLTIVPTYNCPYGCPFCYNKSSALNLTIEDIDTFLSENSNKFDEIIIGGGEPLTLEKQYLQKLIDVITNYKEVTIQTYPVSLDNIIINPKVKYNVSYDLLARPRAREVWSNMLKFPTTMDVTVTLSPLVFKYHPNLILKKFAVFNNINSIEFVPYYKNDNNKFNVPYDTLMKFMKMIISSKMNIKFNVLNVSRLKTQTYENPINYYLVPTIDGKKLKVETFDNDIRDLTPVDSIEDAEKLNINVPMNYNIYNEHLISWMKENGYIN